MLNHKQSIWIASTQLRPKAGTHQIEGMNVNSESTCLLQPLATAWHITLSTFPNTMSDLWNVSINTLFSNHKILYHRTRCGDVCCKWQLEAAATCFKGKSWQYLELLCHSIKTANVQTKIQTWIPWMKLATLQYECITTYITHKVAIFHNPHD